MVLLNDVTILTGQLPISLLVSSHGSSKLPVDCPILYMLRMYKISGFGLRLAKVAVANAAGSMKLVHQ